MQTRAKEQSTLTFDPEAVRSWGQSGPPTVWNKEMGNGELHVRYQPTDCGSTSKAAPVGLPFPMLAAAAIGLGLFAWYTLQYLPGERTKMQQMQEVIEQQKAQMVQTQAIVQQQSAVIEQQRQGIVSLQATQNRIVTDVRSAMQCQQGLLSQYQNPRWDNLHRQVIGNSFKGGNSCQKLKTQQNRISHSQ